MDKLRIAIIGYGYWGPNLVRNFWKNSQCIVTHVVDFDKYPKGSSKWLRLIQPSP